MGHLSPLFEEKKQLDYCVVCGDCHLTHTYTIKMCREFALMNGFKPRQVHQIVEVCERCSTLNFSIIFDIY